MTAKEASAIIEEVLGDLEPGATPEQVEDGFFLQPQFESVRWVPTYSRRLSAKIWAIELYRGDRLPQATIESMAKLASVNHSIQPAFFIPDGEPYEHLGPVCRARGIVLITRVVDKYDVLTFPTSGPPLVGQSAVRIPDWMVRRVAELDNLAPSFGGVLKEFSRQYRQLLSSTPTTDTSQEDLLRKTFLSLLKSDKRFAAEYSPIEFMKFFERESPLYRGRDHYFHTFNNFLLGCFVIDHCYEAFRKFGRIFFRDVRNWSVEYVWLLTVLFHDVGYPIQKHEETRALIYGVQIAGYEQAAAERNEAWQTATYRASRAQVVSLYEHFIRKPRQSQWTPDIFPLDDRRRHPLDLAFEQSFLTPEGHGVASCMRMLAGFFRNTPPAKKSFLTFHIFVAGLSIPFHDRPVRKCLRDQSIDRIRTSQFPFASVLMFVDSIQDDRRGTVREEDILSGLSFKGENTTVAELNLTALSPERLREKRREVSDIMKFIEQDVLKFEYPQSLTS